VLGYCTGMRKKQGQHFADIFEVLEKDPDGKRFDKGADPEHIRQPSSV